MPQLYALVGEGRKNADPRPREFDPATMIESQPVSKR